jgi:hypothetical protein
MQRYAGTSRPAQPRVWARAGAIVGGIGVACVAVAALLTRTIKPPTPFDFDPTVLLVIVVFLVCAPILASRWRVTFWAFLAWLLIEDLIRKSLGNDIRIYFFKDVLFVMLVVGLILDARVRGAWRSATGNARRWLYAAIGWTVILSIPLAFVDWRIPVIALKLDWEYVPLVVAGFVLAREHGIRRLLTGFVALGIPACLVGIIQASVGPSFLRPTITTAASQLLRLDLTRAFDVFQPTGTFVDAARFGSMALLTFVCALALLVLADAASGARTRAFAVIGILVGGGAVWANASKSSIIVAAAAGIVAAFARGFAERRPALVPAIVTSTLIVVGVSGMFALFPQLSSSRVSYLTETLDPRSSSNQWSMRISGWSSSTAQGIRIGGLIGAGTGAGSNGLQYITGSGTGASVSGVAQVEGGYAAVAQQWGVIGLALWFGWSISWFARLWRRTTEARGSRASGAALLLVAWIVYYLFVGFVPGFQSFQNYYANAYLWILSGMVFALGATDPRAVASRRSADAIDVPETNHL